VSNHGPLLLNRILSRLEEAEAKETDPHLQADYRIAWVTVLHADRGYSSPHVSASYQVLGLHPDQVWARIVANRRAMLGPLYEQFSAEERGASLPLKKPVRSVRDPRARRAA